MKKTGNNQYLKELNQKYVLDLIRTGKAVTKADIAEETGLSATASGMIVTELLEKGILCEEGIGESKGGRRPIILKIKENSFYSLGVDIDVNSISYVLLDISGQVVDERENVFSNTKNFKETVIEIEKNVHDLILKNLVPKENILGIGVSVPGMVNVNTGIIKMAPNLGWSNVDLKQDLEKKLSLKVSIENEAMASAICESWLGDCQNELDFVCINIKSGIGAGIFTNGKLYRGVGGTAGEVGHIVVDESGPKCGCGNYGCLETMASTSYIVDKARKLVRQGSTSKLNAFDADKITIEEVINCAKAGDEEALRILNESARYIGIAVSYIVNTLNPKKIVLGKEFTKYASLVMETLIGVVKCKALNSPFENVEILYSTIGERTSTLGAAIIPIKEVFGR